MDGFTFSMSQAPYCSIYPDIISSYLETCHYEWKNNKNGRTKHGLRVTHRAQALTAPLATILPLPSPPPLGEASRKLLRTEKSY